jgi:hypothetical protein
LHPGRRTFGHCSGATSSPALLVSDQWNVGCCIMWLRVQVAKRVQALLAACTGSVLACRGRGARNRGPVGPHCLAYCCPAAQHPCAAVVVCSWHTLGSPACDFTIDVVSTSPWHCHNSRRVRQGCTKGCAGTGQGVLRAVHEQDVVCVDFRPAQTLRRPCKRASRHVVVCLGSLLAF